MMMISSRTHQQRLGALYLPIHIMSECHNADTLYINYTKGIGRKNETDYNFCSSLTSYLGHPKPSFHCVRKLFTILNSLHAHWTSFGMSAHYLKEIYKWCSVSFFLPISVRAIFNQIFGHFSPQIRASVKVNFMMRYGLMCMVHYFILLGFTP